MDLMNPHTLATFRELMEPDELRDFLARVGQDMVAAHAALLQLHQSQDWLALQKLAHRLKGSLGSVGCDALFAQLNKVDAQLIATPARPPSDEDMAALSQVMTATAQRLQAL